LLVVVELAVLIIQPEHPVATLNSPQYLPLVVDMVAFTMQTTPLLVVLVVVAQEHLLLNTQEPLEIHLFVPHLKEIVEAMVAQRTMLVAVVAVQLTLVQTEPQLVETVGMELHHLFLVLL
jgi:hypothetical protein